MCGDLCAFDFGRGSVAFGSDQGMFIQNGTELQLYSANGDVNNKIIMHPAVAQGEDEGIFELIKKNADVMGYAYEGPPEKDARDLCANSFN